MGRRARTNCSPVDSALEKYHNDIGNRLSALFVPPLPTSDEPSDFGMLTLDTRQRNTIKNNSNKDSPLATGNLANNNTDAVSKNITSNTFCSREASKGNTSLRSSSPSSMAASTASSSHSEHDSTNAKEKRGLVDKVTRALFQRKHTCSRCQRKSRSCLPNKNFNGSEKHYMCGNCRENSHAIKHLFAGPSTLSPSPNSSYSSPSQQARKQLNDSGYETVTSCSTVASAYSAFTNAGEGVETKLPWSNPMLGHAPDSCPHHCEDIHLQHDHGPRVYSKPGTALNVLEDAHEESPGLHQFLAPDGVLRQVKTKHTKDYDGYLQNSHHHHVHMEDGVQVVVVRSPLADASNIPCHSDRATVFEAGAPKNSSVPKVCYTCGSASKPCFRLPWAGGWLCEDCMDGMY